MRSVSALARIAVLLVPPLCLALGPSPGPLAAAPREARFLIGGSVREPGGKPIRGATVRLEGLPASEVVTDAHGAYSLSYVLGDVDSLAESPLRLVVRASHRRWRLATLTGASALAIELRRVRRADGVPWLEVRANDERLARGVAAAFRATADVTVGIHADFLRQVGAEDRSSPNLTALASVPLAPEPDSAGATGRAVPGVVSTPGTAAPLPRPVLPDSARLFPSAPEPRVAGVSVPAPPESETVVRPGFQLRVEPDSARRAPASEARDAVGTGLRVAHGRALPDSQRRRPAPASCECRVMGTVEVRSERPLDGSVRVVVSLAQSPAFSDTVDLFMGPPRRFDLGRVPCGRHRLEARSLGLRPFGFAPPAPGVFECDSARTHQFRVMLEPR
jgi:hypothetical protein